MNKNQELYIAIGAILKELKTELTNNLSDYIGINSKFNNDTSDNIALILDEVGVLDEKLGNSNQVIIDTNVERAEEIKNLEVEVKKLKDITTTELVTKKIVADQLGIINTELTKLITNSNVNTDENIKVISSTLSKLTTTVDDLSKKENPSFDYVDNANDAVMDFTVSTLNKLREMADNSTKINTQMLHDLETNQDSVDNNLKDLLKAVFKINDHLQVLLNNKQVVETKFEAVSDYQNLNKKMVKDQLSVNDTFLEQIEKLFELVAGKSDDSLVLKLSADLDKKLISLENRSIALDKKVKNFKPGKAIDDKIKAIHQRINDNTDIDSVRKDVMDLNDLIKDFELKHLSRFENITTIVAELENEFAGHKSKAFDILKKHTEELQEYVDDKLDGLSKSIDNNESALNNLDWSVKTAEKDIEGFSDQLSDHMEDLETVNQNLKQLEDGQATHQNVLVTHKLKLDERKEDMSKLFNDMNTQVDALDDLSNSVSVNKSSFEEKIGTIEHDLEDSLSDLNKGVIESRIAKDVLSKAKEFVDERSEISDAKIIGKANEFIVSLAGSMKGEKGDEGDLNVCDEWEEGQTTECLVVVTHHRGLWQCINATDSEPSFNSKDWNLIASGTKDVFTRLVGDDVRLELVTVDSTGEEKVHNIDYPLPNLLGTYDEDQDYEFYDSVVWKGDRWISRSVNPKGDPAKSEDWVLFSMHGPRGAKGLKGDKGDMPSVDNVIKALNQAELDDEKPPVRRWSGLWKYNKKHQVGDLLSFDAGIWLTVVNDDGTVPPSDVNNKNFVLLLLSSVQGGSLVSEFTAAGPVADSVAADVAALVIDHNNLLAELRTSGILLT